MVEIDAKEDLKNSVVDADALVRSSSATFINLRIN